MRQYYNRGWTYCSIILTIAILLFNCSRVVAQTQKITGTVRDVQGAALPGVSVVVAGTSTGTITDVEGKFSISAAKGNTLNFSFVGYQPFSEKIANADVLNIQLVTDETNLSEVVVVGYGTQTKRELTGAISNIKAAELKDIPATNISQRLQGKLAGVQINQNTGQPGAELSIRIRGAASINAGNNPLIVVDGFPTTSGLNVINPDAIESITVLKDAAAASLYGSRAANGVILVTTKQAKNGQRNVQFSSFVGVQSVSDRGKPDLMNAPEFAQFKKEYYEDAALYEGYKGGVPQQYQNPSQYSPNDGTNWFNVLLRTAAIQDYNLSISTDAKTVQSVVHLGYNKQDGVMLNNSASRFTVRANNIFSVSPKLRLGMNLAATHYVTNITPGLGEGRNIIQVAYLSDPTLKYKNDDGTYPIGFAPPGMFSTPNYYQVLMQTVNPAKYMVLIGNAYVDYQILKGLNVKSSININTSNDINRLFQPSTILGGPTPAASASGSYNTANYLSWLSENTLTYNRSFGNHNLEALLGYTTQKVKMENSNINGSQFPDNSVQWLNVAANRIGNVGASDYSLISYLGRLNYNYKGNYLLSLAFRSDGSSRFGSNKRFGTFPSASFGWVVSDEKFMNRYKSINFLKVRASYGQVGNNNIGNYTYLAGVNPSNYVFNNALASGRVLSGIGNSNLTWETTTGFDAGLDLSLLNNRINFTYDYYYKKTDGLLYAIDIPVQSGYSAVSSNIGRFDFWGHEFAIDTRNIEGKFNWSTSFNISFNRNLVRKLGTNNAPIGGYQEYWDDNRTAVGHPIGLFYGYVNTGVYMTQQEFDSQPHGATSMIGTARFADINGDGKIDINDRTYIGNPNPDFVYGMTNTLSYKKLDLSIVIAGTVGNDIADDAFQSTENIDGVFNVRKGVARRWRSPENPGDGIYPRTRAGTTADFRNFSTRQVFSGTYLAVKNITLGYLIPIGNNKTIKSFRAYFSTQNPVLFTKYPGMNPEVGLAGLNGLNQGRDFTAFPIARVYTLGVNVNF
ncbi:SusC/RagA family TonB-linked outer membrane protein [Spirosoma foliorum]|uniref:TonB-dependent receptor n=1 Tax=Spirosoma foliorum TaxID=2710596 RepID=A0A7G5H121_9BACT|nr:TonB-dependent receptor [Spirosoma foliorum]QMW04813.1 TonB-dependent receptor [Spirosoma foliorum]